MARFLRSSGVLLLMLAARSVVADPEQPLITDAPKLIARELVERQQNPLIGYQLAGDTNYITMTCNAGTFSTSGSWGICCPFASCYYGTSCAGGSIYYDRTSFVSNCNTGGGGLGLCYTVTLYKSTGDQSPLHMFNCESNWKATFNTGIVAAVTNTSPLSTTASDTSSSGSSGSSSATTDGATSGGAVAVGPSPTGLSNTGGGKSNAGLIAGAVIGGIAALALVGIAILLAIRYGKKNRTTPDAAATSDAKYGSAPNSAPVGYVEPYKDGGMQQQQAPYGQQPYPATGYYGTPQYPAEVQGSQTYVPQAELQGTPVGGGQNMPGQSYELPTNKVKT